MVSRQCLICEREFFAPQSKINQGKGLYCSKSCSGKARHGNQTLEQRFWNKVDKSIADGCWLWTGSLQSPWNYGSFQRGKGSDEKKHSVLAHRMAYELTYGLIPTNLFVCHRCDNPQCVRPDHLFLGTHSDNMADMHQKGRSISQAKPERHARGERQGLAKLTDDDIRTIRAIYKPGKAGYSSDVSMTSLSRRYHVSKTTMASIIRRETWRHIE